MNLGPSAPELALIEVAEPGEERCAAPALPPEGNVKLRNYRALNETLRAYSPTGDVHTSPGKNKLVARFDVSAAVSPPRARILQLVRAGDPGRAALEAIVRPAPRRGLARPLDDDARRFLQRALLSPSPYGCDSASPEPPHRLRREAEPPPAPRATDGGESSPGSDEDGSGAGEQPERSLADELREAEAEAGARRVRAPESASGARGAEERARLARLALAVEEDAGLDGAGGAGLGAAGRRLDALLAESRALHDELAGIQRDLQVESARACRCTADARVLIAETRALRYLDDVVALLRGDVKAAVRARSWPFALGHRSPGRNYIV